ncbi:MAG TPA: alpha/beta hydrolase [Amnibacterium sp.]|nr:alpha/beta hydrolase [Amnibacterium sp.]
MRIRVLVLLGAALLTMGAVAAPKAAGDPFRPPDRSVVQHDLTLLTAAAEGPSAGAAVRALLPHLTAFEDLAPDPARTARWWADLPSGTRSLLLADAPGIVGNLEGVPYPIRDAANRAVLSADLAGVRGRLAVGAGRGESRFLAERMRALEKVQQALQRSPGGAPRFLLALDPTNGDRAAIAIGDVQTADYVDFLVPGMYFTVADQMVDWTDTAAAIQSEQQQWLRHFGDSRRSAVVSWIGYRTPNVFTVASFGVAQIGAARLTDAVNGLKAARGASTPYTAVLAHSYGATAALLALQAHAFSVDALAMVGAPGSPAQSVRQLSVPAQDVFVGQAVWDGVATSGFFGSDPAAPSYGATPLGTSGGVDPITHLRLRAAVGHNGYFAPGCEAMRNLALVGIGRGGDVTAGTDRTSGTLALAR